MDKHHCWFSRKQYDYIRRNPGHLTVCIYLIGGEEKVVTAAASKISMAPNWDDAIYLGEGTYVRGHYEA